MSKMKRCFASAVICSGMALMAAGAQTWFVDARRIDAPDSDGLTEATAFGTIHSLAPRGGFVILR